jgi:hypothetical protein
MPFKKCILKNVTNNWSVSQFFLAEIYKLKIWKNIKMHGQGGSLSEL